ncbi:T9SS type A sorting domain-containing protein [Salmonirosea aquatica]
MANVTLTLVSVANDNCSQNLSATSTVTVNPLPDASFSGLSSTYCADASAVTLTANVPGGTFSGPGVSGSTFTPAQAGSGGSITYSITVNGCTSSSQQSVTVNPLPDASFTGLAGTYCADASAVTLTPTTPGGTFGGPGVSGSIFTPAQAGSGGSITYSITVNGCTNATSQSVTVNPAPDASFTGLAATYCADASAVTLIPSTPGGTFSGPGVSGSTFTPANAGSGGSITYSVTVNGCTSSSQQSVTVNPLPDASFSGLSSTYCADASAVTLTANVPGGTFSGPGVSGSTFTPAQAGSGGSITYSITVNGCSNSSSQSVTVNPAPDASFSGLFSTYCADASPVTLTPTTPGGTFSGPGVSGSTFTPAQAGSGGSITYSITVNGCTSSSQQSVTVNPLPDASFTGLAATYCADASPVTLTPTTPGGTFSGPGVSGSTFTPAQAGSGGSITYSITVNGCSNSSSQSVTVNPAPDASFTGLTSTYCADASAVTLTPTTPGGTFSGPGVSGSTFTPAQAGSGGSITYSITVNGCTNATSQSVTVNPAPDASFSGLSATYCADASAVTLIPSTPGGTFSGPGVSGSTFTPANAGSGGSITYSVTVNGCTSSSQQSVTVNPLPDASFSGLSSTYCADASAVTLTANVPGGTFSGPGVSGSTFTPAQAGSGGSITYSITVNGCSNSSSQSVTVNPAPDASFSGLFSTYCADASAVTLTPTTPGGTFGGPGVSGSIFTPAQAGSGGSITYSITVNGCSNSSSQSVTVNPAPDASFTGLAATYCADASAVTLIPSMPGGTFSGPGVSGNIFTPAQAGSGGNITYSITVNGCTSSSQQSVTVNPLPDASFTGLSSTYCADASAVTLTPTTPGGTFSGQGVSGSTFDPAQAGSGTFSVTYSVSVDGCSNASSQNVTVRPAITLNTSGNTTVTYGYGSNCTTLTASASGGTGAIGLAWSTGATGTSTQVCPGAQTTTYTVTATDAAGCSVQKQITVTVNDVRCGYGGVKVCLGGREQCIAQYLVPTYLRFGYTLGGCSNNVPSRIGYGPQEATPPSLALSVKAYPNPTSGRLTLQVSSPVAGPARLDVLDLVGRAVQQRTEQLSEGLNEIEMDLGGQAAEGVYLIRCRDALGGQAVVRVQKQ